ncbi:hypothetical protein HYDPIDRAFT_157814 [Hydnomerulius pinastri MD-312]|uniref:G-alpha-domain-containing protein n=1 Tax=Hydnomerulius pinastri MD-312 TaxID=994086 RepID=A0A0C9VW95_9AGAM|nr:hypothetical protein HYDPIDRAFT_157814 [Hydnomerulius pinastri MD-312]
MTYRTSLEKLAHRTTQDDGWSAIFRPSPNETPEEKKERIARQQEANRVSKEIDESIEKSRKLYEKRKKAIKVLLLGQAESGKSTMLRNFQLAFCPTYFHSEISIWKTIIQLNLIGSVKKLLSIIEDELDSQASRSPRGPLSSSPHTPRSPISASPRLHSASSPRTPLSPSTGSFPALPPPVLLATGVNGGSSTVNGNGNGAGPGPSSLTANFPTTDLSTLSVPSVDPLFAPTGDLPPAGVSGLAGLLSALENSESAPASASTLRLGVPGASSTSRVGTPSPASNTRNGVAPSASRSAVGSAATSRHPLSQSTSAVQTDHDKDQDPDHLPITQAHSALRLRLLPLLSVETNLARQLLPEWGGGVSPSALNSGSTSGLGSGWAKWASGGAGGSENGLGLGKGEVCVRAGGGWKSVIERVSNSGPPGPGQRPSTADTLRQPIDPSATSSSSSSSHSSRAARPHPSDPTPLLQALAPDIYALWKDPAVQGLLKRRGVRMEDSAGFFLNDVMRIGKPGWKPAVEDIVRARLRTFGVEEHRFLMDNGSEWYIYDVGGSRSMRPQWVPYFDDVQAIIFLAPLVFNQVLDEDRMVNRLEDSIYLWKEVCTNALLARANIILFLNKMDILESTLKAGIRVETYVPSYGNQPNEIENVVKYFREKFRAYHRRLSPRQRTFFCHETSAIDTHATQAVLVGVREGILRNHLEKLNVI